MDWRGRISEWNGRMSRERWLLLLAAGAVLMVATLPAKRANEGASAAIQSANNAVLAGRTFGEHSGIDEGTLSKKNNSDSVSVLAQVKRDDYARELEERVRAILSQVQHKQSIGT